MLDEGELTGDRYEGGAAGRAWLPQAMERRLGVVEVVRRGVAPHAEEDPVLGDHLVPDDVLVERQDILDEVEAGALQGGDVVQIAHALAEDW
eukprot:scaffold122968_cov58-Phaeocystis_antarctica.AAC.3